MADSPVYLAHFLTFKGLFDIMTVVCRNAKKRFDKPLSKWLYAKLNSDI